MGRPAVKSTPILEGKISLYQRNGNSTWHCAFTVNNQLTRKSTHKDNFNEAKEEATELYLTARIRAKEGLPAVSKSFKSVAQLMTKETQAAIDSGVGKEVFQRYIEVTNNYLIPFFGNKHIDKIDHLLMKEYSVWRRTKFGVNPAFSTITTHNSALARIFDVAVSHKYISNSQIPAMMNDGAKGIPRPDFTLDEYKQIVKFCNTWVDGARTAKGTEMRHVLRDYFLILADTGIRHGTEAMNIQWKHISFTTIAGVKYIQIHVDGKTGQRDPIATHNCSYFLKRLQMRNPVLAKMSFEDLIAKGDETFLFSDSKGVKCNRLNFTFETLCKDSGLLVDRRTGLNRSLYSWRHYYITQALIHNKMSIHQIAKQCGNTVAVIESFYENAMNASYAKDIAGTPSLPFVNFDELFTVSD